jgi:hypothetical protein
VDLQASGAFFGAAVGSVESVWSIPKLGQFLLRRLLLLCPRH